MSLNIILCSNHDVLANSLQQAIPMPVFGVKLWN